MKKLTWIRSQHALAAIALVLGSSAAIARVPSPENTARDGSSSRSASLGANQVSAVQLAQWIRDTKAGLRVVDIRDSIQFDELHIAGAERIDVASLAGSRFSPDETIVVYSDVEADAARAQTILTDRGHPRPLVLHGGISEWIDDILNPTLASNATDSARKEFERVAELSRYFGGVPRITEPGDTVAAGSTGPQSAKRIRGRGC